MIPASRSIGPVREAARPMPWIEEMRPVYDLGVTFRAGQLIMVAGHPGSGKSLWVQWLCHRWNRPTLYFSMDMSQSDTVTRLGALCTGMTSDAVKKAFERDDDESIWVEEQLESSLMDFVYDDAPTLQEFVTQLQAYEEMYGHLPEVLVIDNLVDIDHEGDDEYRAWNQTLLWLKSLCRNTGMTVIVVHHARELDSSDYPAARKDFAGKPGRTPELMFSVALTPRGSFRVAIVKNRSGGGTDAKARSGIEFTTNPSKGTFRPSGAWMAPLRRGENRADA